MNQRPSSPRLGWDLPLQLSPDSPRMPVPRAVPLPRGALVGTQFWGSSQVLVTAVLLVCGPLIFGFHAVVLGIQGDDVWGGAHHARVFSRVFWCKTAANRHCLLGLRQHRWDPVCAAGTAGAQGQAYWTRHGKDRSASTFLHQPAWLTRKLEFRALGIKQDPFQPNTPSRNILTWRES